MIKKCIFCDCDTSNSKSVEHIIPESLGNSELILEKGVVCDKCNNYFSNKIEKKVLELSLFQELSFYERTPSKKGNFKKSTILICGEESEVSWFGDNNLIIKVSPKTAEKIIKEKPRAVISKRANIKELVDNYDVSRFLYKIAFEYYIYMALQQPENSDADSFVFSDEMKAIIRFVRIGNKECNYIPYKVREIKSYKPFSNNGNISLKFVVEDSNDNLLKLLISFLNIEFEIAFYDIDYLSKLSI